MDLAYPTGEASARRPAVVFVNGVGGKLNEWEIYKSWARLVAAHGLVGITAESDPAKPAESVRALFAHLAKEGAALRLDTSRLAVWACSANVRAALPFLMGGAPAGVRAAVILYGTGDAATLRKDLPVFWVLAGRDSPSLLEGQRALWARAIKEGTPWTMVSAPDLPHAFDGVEDTSHSRKLVREMVEFLLSGRKDDAFARLTEVAGTGWLTREQLEGDADLASLKSDPRFGALLSKLAAPSEPR
jgi:dienelactone hydrolase